MSPQKNFTKLVSDSPISNKYSSDTAHKYNLKINDRNAIIGAKYVQKTMVSLLLILNLFHSFFSTSAFEQVKVCWL